LALSSRNIYLVDADRVQALALHEALEAGVAAASGGPAAVVDATLAHLSGCDVKVDYVSLVDPGSFEPMQGGGPAILVVAAHVGSTRLIDNVRLHVGADERR
jgi:pantoate--beta-alanine ligase